MFAFRHLEHTFSRLGAPSTVARMRWTLGFQRRRVRLCEWLMLFPNRGVFPQMSQTELMRSARLPKRFRASEMPSTVDAPP